MPKIVPPRWEPAVLLLLHGRRWRRRHVGLLVVLVIVVEALEVGLIHHRRAIDPRTGSRRRTLCPISDLVGGALGGGGSPELGEARPKGRFPEHPVPYMFEQKLTT